MMSDLRMRGRVLRIVAVSLCPILHRLSDSSAHISPPKSRDPGHACPRCRGHDLDPVAPWQPSDEAGPTSLQGGRDPPCRSSSHVVRDSSSTLQLDRKWRVTP